jgi:hypothetical protein
MTDSKFLFQVAAFTAAAFTLMTPARAVTLNVVPSSIYQSGTTALVYHGHTVVASTNMNRLEAGGSFRATCMSPDTGSITGSRSLPAAALLGGLQLYVTVPAQLPGLKPMPGFESAPRGANLQCSYDWTAYSREAQYTLGVPGVSVPIGGGEMSLSSSVSFRMRKPGTATGNDDACIP